MLSVKATARGDSTSATRVLLSGVCRTGAWETQWFDSVVEATSAGLPDNGMPEGRIQEMMRPLLLLVASVLGLGLPLTADAAGGDLDPSFGSGGEVLTDLGNAHGSNARAVAMQADGKIVVAGFSTISTNYDDHFALARFKSDGT